jgi:pimeloyl-ACP methyl ester carboxylesterase
MPATPSPVVLVHGAWHGPWCWERVTPLLHERGIETIALDLPTMDANAGHVTTMHDDAKSLRAALDALQQPAVVVGHSYGGAVITEGAANHPMTKRLVYLAAFMPDAGQSVNDLTRLDPNPAFAGALQFENGRAALVPQRVGELLYNDCSDEVVAWAIPHLRSMQVDFGEAAAAAAWRAIPSTYVVCTQDRTIPPTLQRHMAQQAGEVIEWDASHSPFASQPALVADLLERLARD